MNAETPTLLLDESDAAFNTAASTGGGPLLPRFLDVLSQGDRRDRRVPRHRDAAVVSQQRDGFKSAITPALSGRTALSLGGVRPTIAWASAPTATI